MQANDVHMQQFLEVRSIRRVRRRASHD